MLECLANGSTSISTCTWYELAVLVLQLAWLTFCGLLAGTVLCCRRPTLLGIPPCGAHVKHLLT